jgi:AmmeMemoRadiSam system protein A
MAMIEPALRERLLDFARAALEARVRRMRRPAVPSDLDRPASGVFVTIHCDGDLRGCLGTVDRRDRLGEAVARLAADVATEDYRFAPITEAELERVTIALSVLTTPVRVMSLDDIEVGRHGLIVEQGRHRGLLLPQVATEHGWDRETFLRQTSNKAGLPPDAWAHATVLCFEAEVFEE